MNTFITSLNNISYTDNGAVTHATSLNKCLDLFFIAGASRRMDEQSILKMFKEAYQENPVTAMLILFWARDCRGGAGERRFFQTIARAMLTKDDYIPNSYEVMDLLVHLVPEYGSWKDLLRIEDPNKDTLNLFHTAMTDVNSHSLAAKWFPRKGKWFVAMHKYLGITPKELRKLLVERTNVVESAMCSKQFGDIKYSAVPSVAMNKYRNAFWNRDAKRFTEFNIDVREGKESVNADVLFPHQLFQALQKNNYEYDINIENQWQALPDYMNSSENILPVCDVSGSMSGLPMDVSVSLGVYIAERNKGPFRDYFMTFSDTPELVELQGSTTCERMTNLKRAHWGFNTNLQRTFDLILERGHRDSVKPEDMPTKLLIISDMEFDMACGNSTNLEIIRDKYASSGYTMPEIIFWNVNGRAGNLPAKSEDKGIGLVSGFSPAILKSILLGTVETPYQLMLRTLYTERYKPVLTWLKQEFGDVYDFGDSIDSLG